MREEIKGQELHSVFPQGEAPQVLNRKDTAPPATGEGNLGCRGVAVSGGAQSPKIKLLSSG